eukprot:Nk52_evm3s235 gene=Nk52_evmTU3s235
MADLERIRALIQAHPDFPKKGILFQDIFPVFRHPDTVRAIMHHILYHIQSTFGKVDVIVGLDARGFLFGPILALELNAAFVPVRKSGKLPGECVKASYEKEYGVDQFEMQKDAIKPGQKVIIVDDLLATGGSLNGAVSLVKECGGNVVESIVLIELVELNGKQNVPSDVYSLLKY